MSSGPLLILMALTSFLFLPRGVPQTTKPDSLAGLLLSDELEKAENLLNQQPRGAESTAFRGEIEFRRGDFAKAGTLYQEALRIAEPTARAHFGLGKLALARLRQNEAIRHLRRAIDLEPGEPLYRLYLAEAQGVARDYPAQKEALRQYLRLSGTSDPDRVTEAKAALDMLESLGDGIGAVTAPARLSPIPFQTTLGLIFARVTVNGTGPHNFVIDTGATQVVIGEKVVAALGLKPIATTIMHGVGGGGKVESRLYRIDELEMGDVRIRNLPVGTFGDPLVSQLADGILGTSALSEFSVTINYPEKQLELARPALPAAVSAGETLPAWYFSNLLLVPAEVNGKFHGNFVVDTGAVSTVLSHSMAEKLGVTVATSGSRGDVGVVGVGGMEVSVLRVPDVSLRLGSVSRSFPTAVSIDFKNISRMIGTEISGVIGFDVLGDQTITLDYKNAEVRLKK